MVLKQLTMKGTLVINQRMFARSLSLSLSLSLSCFSLLHCSVARRDHLKPLELELRRIEDLTSELGRDFEYLKEREARMRQTNESTFERVK